MGVGDRVLTLSLSSKQQVQVRDQQWGAVAYSQHVAKSELVVKHIDSLAEVPTWPVRSTIFVVPQISAGSKYEAFLRWNQVLWPHRGPIRTTIAIQSFTNQTAAMRERNDSRFGFTSTTFQLSNGMVRVRPMFDRGSMLEEVLYGPNGYQRITLGLSSKTKTLDERALSLFCALADSGGALDHVTLQAVLDDPQMRDSALYENLAYLAVQDDASYPTGDPLVFAEENFHSQIAERIGEWAGSPSMFMATTFFDKKVMNWLHAENKLFCTQFGSS